MQYGGFWRLTDLSSGYNYLITIFQQHAPGRNYIAINSSQPISIDIWNGDKRLNDIVISATGVVD